MIILSYLTVMVNSNRSSNVYPMQNCYCYYFVLNLRLTPGNKLHSGLFCPIWHLNIDWTSVQWMNVNFSLRSQMLYTSQWRMRTFWIGWLGRWRVWGWQSPARTWSRRKIPAGWHLNSFIFFAEKYIEIIVVTGYI